MAENTTVNPGAGGDVIATDELTTLNGSPSSGVKIQRIKVCHGDDNDARDASAAYPLPIVLLPTNATAGMIVGPTLVKGAQQTEGFIVQQMHNGGRAFLNAATAIAGVTAVNAEAIMTLNVGLDGAAPSAITTIPVTATKRLRLTGMMVGFVSTAAAVLSGRVSLRCNPAGAAIATSPIILTVALSSGAALAQAGNQIFVPIPDGYEFSGTQQIGVSQIFNAVTGTVWVSLLGFEF